MFLSDFELAPNIVITLLFYLNTVFDLWEQHNNTVKDVTPFPDQDIIHNDMARVAYHSKFDMSEVYEQICIVPEHIHKMVFATVLV